MSKEFNNSLKEICVKKPRIIFLTGKKCCGKTTFSNGLKKNVIIKLLN